MQKKHPLQEMLEPLIDEMGFDLVRVITIGNVNPTLQIMIERKDRENIVVDDCAAVSRAGFRPAGRKRSDRRPLYSGSQLAGT